ncbi:MAG: asparagine synthase (glutamine-hydrolyzing) [Chloroflexota bacterium]|nr:MAG: asparagine synthase (glutamine-hydrolyzing) [Chloroflexota bacterium]
MCGIVGQLSEHGFSASFEKCALAALHHRGPDDEGVWNGEGVFLGMTRLSIIDLAGGHQPMWNEDGTCCIVYNGELYNYLDLRPDLQARGHAFQTQSDTEVVLHAFEEWGQDCLRRFNGMFAFAIWDTRTKALFLARDRIGEKPLYYYRDDERFVFASEIKAILAESGVARALNPRGLANYLAFGHALAPDTMYRGVHKLLPGHFLVIRDGTVSTSQYWDVGDDPQLSAGAHISEDEAAERILALLDDSVKRRMIADVPLGAFLSGGLDSSAIVSLMKRHATGAVKTFSLGFTVGGAYNELSDAARVARELGTEHHELHVEHVDLIETLDTLVHHYDEPFGDAASFPLYLLSRFAREHVKVVLSGDGGDELFGGYRRYGADQLAPLYQRLPVTLTESWVPALVERMPRLRRIKRSVRSLPIKDPARRYASWLVSFTPEMQAELLQPDIMEQLDSYDPAWPYPHYYPRLNGATEADHLNRLMYVDVKTWLADTYMEKTDKATMACSLEARLPLLDYRLVELAFQLPGTYKIRGWSTKRILKRAVRDIVPPFVLRKRKHGFSVPIDPWFREDLKSFAFEVLLDDSTRRRGYFDHKVVERFWREHVEGREVRHGQLWLLLNFELWHRMYLDSSPR